MRPCRAVRSPGPWDTASIARRAARTSQARPPNACEGFEHGRHSPKRMGLRGVRSDRAACSPSALTGRGWRRRSTRSAFPSGSERAGISGVPRPRSPAKTRRQTPSSAAGKRRCVRRTALPRQGAARGRRTPCGRARAAGGYRQDPLRVLASCDDRDFHERLEAVLGETFRYGPYFRTVQRVQVDTISRGSCPTKRSGGCPSSACRSVIANAGPKSAASWTLVPEDIRE